MPRKISSRPPRSTPTLSSAFEPVRRAVADLPGVEEGTSYGTPSLHIRGKFFTRLKEDGDSLVLRVDFDSRDAMLKAQPHAFYITDHYRDYPAVLVRLSAVSPTQLRELLADSWRWVAPKSLVTEKDSVSAAPKRRSR